MSEVWMFLASFIGVFFKVIQGRNFTFDNYIWVVPTSVALAAVDMFIITNIVRLGYSVASVLIVGIGSGLGAMLGMFIHRRFIKKKG
jgi:hypothetical protein